MPFPVKVYRPQGKDFAIREEVHYKWNPETLKPEKVIINPEEDIQKGESLSLKELAKNGIKPVLDNNNGFQGDMRIFRDSNIHNDFKAAFTEIVDDKEESVKDPVKKVEDVINPNPSEDPVKTGENA